MRRSSYLLAAVAACLALAAPAAATSVTRPVRPALPPSLPRTVEAPCPRLTHALGCYDATTNTIYTAWGREPFLVNHELGHAFDAQVLTDAQRFAFAKMVGRPGAAWENTYECPSPEDVCVGLAAAGVEEIFADEYSTCRLRMLPRATVVRRRGDDVVATGNASWPSDYVPATNAKQRRTCRAISRWARTPT